MGGFVKFAKKMISLLGNDREKGRYKEYEFLDYETMFAGHLPLTYERFSNLLISDGSQDKDLNTSECRRELGGLGVPKNFPPLATQFYISVPFFGYEIVNVEKLPFSAKGTSISKLGDEYMVSVHPDPGEISNQDIKEVLKSVVINRDYDPQEIIDLYKYRPKKLHTPSELKISHSFMQIVHNICFYLKLDIGLGETLSVKGSPLVPEGANFEESVFRDIVIYDKGRIVCIIEMKQTGLFEIEERANPPVSALSSGNMEGIMKQLQLYMITASIRFGILCDGYNLILAEFENDYLYNSKVPGKPILKDSEKLPIPFETKILNLNSSCPTFLEGFIYLLEKAKLNPDASEFYKRLPAPLILKYSYTPAKRRRDSSEIVQFTFLSLNSGAELLQRSKDHITTVYKVKAKYVKEVIQDDIDDDEYVVVKIYDPYVPHSSSTKCNDSHTQEAVRRCYISEWNSIQTLFGAKEVAKEYNNIYLRHGQIEVHCFRGAGPVIVGNCIISRYIDSEEIPMTLEVYKQAKEQLQVVVDSGVIHGDIELRNFLFKNKIYLYDFSHSELQENFEPDRINKLIDEDFRQLDNAFYKVLKV